MKVRKASLCFILITLMCCVALGIYSKTTYTNITSKDNYLDDFLVAEIIEEVSANTCEGLMNTLPTAPIIVSVSPIDNIEHLFGQSQQRVKIVKVFKGNELCEGDEIYITSDRWSVIIRDNSKKIERGFVNILKRGENYLAFLDTMLPQREEDTPVYKLYNSTRISPVFCYNSLENTLIAPNSSDTTYVNYYLVSNNEFFATSQESLEPILQLKKYMIERYPLKELQ